MKFIDLSKKDRLDILERVSSTLNVPQKEVIEKDWWVTTVLRAMFSLPYANHLSFKGGTSLSKCWHLIDRFSEDIDIAIDREFLGFGGTLSKTQISDKLRRAACSFVRETLQRDLAEQLYNNGISKNKFRGNVDITPISTTDPEVIDIDYDSALSFSIDEKDGQYILPKVKVEVSGRSMSEPVCEVALDSMIDQVYPVAPFSEPKFTVRAVLAERTFLESNFNYDTLYPSTLNIVPPASIMEQWKADYENMQRYMIYNESVPFEKLINDLKELNEKIKGFANMM